MIIGSGLFDPKISKMAFYGSTNPPLSLETTGATILCTSSSSQVRTTEIGRTVTSEEERKAAGTPEMEPTQNVGERNLVPQDDRSLREMHTVALAKRKSSQGTQ